MVSYLNNQINPQPADRPQIHILFKRGDLFLQRVEWLAAVSQRNAEHVIRRISNSLSRAADIHNRLRRQARMIDSDTGFPEISSGSAKY